MVSTTCMHARSLYRTRFFHQQRIIDNKRVSCQTPSATIRLSFSCKQSEGYFV